MSNRTRYERLHLHGGHEKSRPQPATPPAAIPTTAQPPACKHCGRGISEHHGFFSTCDAGGFVQFAPSPVAGEGAAQVNEPPARQWWCPTCEKKSAYLVVDFAADPKITEWRCDCGFVRHCAVVAMDGECNQLMSSDIGVLQTRLAEAQARAEHEIETAHRFAKKYGLENWEQRYPASAICAQLSGELSDARRSLAEAQAETKRLNEQIAKLEARARTASGLAQLAIGALSDQPPVAPKGAERKRDE